MAFASIIRRYALAHRPNALAELAWFADQPTLGEAVRLTALALDERGNRYAHQRRIKGEALEAAKARLLRAVPDLGAVKTFDELHNLVETEVISISGVGELYVYDTALRIGVWLGLLPEKVYLHAGAREGATALGLIAPNEGHRKAIEPEVLPEGLRRLPPHEIEDVLCIFKNKV